MEVHVIEPTLNEMIFGAKPRTHLLHQAVVMQLANRRTGSAATKSKGFVSGGGKKPWRQKGTGRARRQYPVADLGWGRHCIRSSTSGLLLSYAANSATGSVAFGIEPQETRKQTYRRRQIGA